MNEIKKSSVFQVAFRDLEFHEKELFRFNHFSVDLILRYQYRFRLKGAY